MKKSSNLFLLMVLFFSIVGLSSCDKTTEPDDKEYYSLTIIVIGDGEVRGNYKNTEKVEKDEEVKLTAYYQDKTISEAPFYGWFMNGQIYEDNLCEITKKMDSEITFKMTQDTTIVAMFINESDLKNNIVFGSIEKENNKDSYSVTIYSMQELDFNQNPELPTAPIKTGYVFKGWYPFVISGDKIEYGWDENGNKVGDLDLSNNLEYIFYNALYEEIKPIEYTVKFVDYNDILIDEQKVVKGTSAKAPAEPTREGYQFTSWDKDFSNVTSDLVVKALYEEIKPIEYTVKFVDEDKITIFHEGSYKENTLFKDILPTNPSDKNNGYTNKIFKEWVSVSGEALNINDLVNQNIEFIATYEETPVIYTITYHVNNSELNDYSCKEEDKYSYLSKPSLAIPTATGYKFLGWYLNAEGNGEKFSQIPTDAKVNYDLYAKWEKEIQVIEGVAFKVRTKSITDTQVVVELIITGDVLCASYDLKLTYDDRVLKYSSKVNGKVNVVNTNKAGIVLLNYSNFENLTSECVLLTLTFDVTSKTSTSIDVEVREANAITDSYEVYTINTIVINATIKF